MNLPMYIRKGSVYPGEKADLAALDRTVCAAVLCDFAGKIRTGLQRVRIYLSEFQGVI